MWSALSIPSAVSSGAGTAFQALGTAGNRAESRSGLRGSVRVRTEGDLGAEDAQPTGKRRPWGRVSGASLEGLAQ